MTALQKADPQGASLVVSESAALMQVIARAASDPACDLDKMERLMAMHERAMAKQAEVAFAEALAELQSELPSIGERGAVNGRYTYALWEDINTAIKPFLKAHGFSLSFRVETANGITVTGVLQHRAGHKESTSITLPPDASGNKPAVQAVASSVSYGKRYTAGALLNLTSHGEDDDAYSASKGSDEAAIKAADWIRSAGQIQEPGEYEPLLSKLKADYGSVNAIPAPVKAAFNAAKSRVMPKD